MTEKYVKFDDIFEYCDSNIACLQGQSVAQAALRRVKEYVAANAADVQPVKIQPMNSGRWIDCTFYDPYEKSYEQNFEYKCSCCGHMIYNKPNNDNLFCGHCGARMDGDSECQ